LHEQFQCGINALICVCHAPPGEVCAVRLPPGDFHPLANRARHPYGCSAQALHDASIGEVSPGRWRQRTPRRSWSNALASSLPRAPARVSADCGRWRPPPVPILGVQFRASNSGRPAVPDDGVRVDGANAWRSRPAPLRRGARWNASAARRSNGIAVECATPIPLRSTQLLSARIQDAVWWRQFLVGYTPRGAEAKQNRDNHHGITHGLALKRYASRAQGPSDDPLPRGASARLDALIWSIRQVRSIIPGSGQNPLRLRPSTARFCVCRTERIGGKTPKTCLQPLSAIAEHLVDWQVSRLGAVRATSQLLEFVAILRPERNSAICRDGNGIPANSSLARSTRAGG